jgi:hypothetical protein
MLKWGAVLMLPVSYPVTVLPLIWLSAQHGTDSVSVTIGLRKDGRLATTMATPERRQQEWVVWQS